MSLNKNKILLLISHPREPIFVPKGPSGTIFDVPLEYLPQKFRPLASVLADRFATLTKEKITIQSISPLPDLTAILDLKRDDNFSVFIPKHQAMASSLVDIFMGMLTVEELLSCACYVREHVNPYLFNYCLSAALMHRPDTSDLTIPSTVVSFPDKYVDPRIFEQGREQASLLPPGVRTPVELAVNLTASSLDEESRIAYFREDLGANSHHWHWHLVYPLSGRRSIVAKNRRGELFYYMHQQVLARYNFERFCNKLNRTEKLNVNEPIKEGYYSKLNSVVASRAYPPRAPNQRLQDLNRPGDNLLVSVDDLKRWTDRIYDATHQGRVTTEGGQSVRLTEREGIDILGNIVEASDLSPNKTYYGDLHNSGHSMIAYIHDPDGRFKENFGVMGDVATAMRDPVFYRWHTHIDNIFTEHKNTLPSYNTAQLDYPGVTIDSVSVEGKGSPPNILDTFWQRSDADMSRGMDFQASGGAVFVRFTHLQHQPFSYRIVVNNNQSNKLGTCRIFLAPKYDEQGGVWQFRDQKHMFIEMDKFPVKLKQGRNTFVRSSEDSSVTISFERTFRELDEAAVNQFQICGCGWPQHLLVPKGTKEGFPCELFVMISEYEGDVVKQDTNVVCDDSHSFCGLKDRLYPDRRAMGYPFDRLPKVRGSTLQQFLTKNMRIQNVVIKFNDRVLSPKQRFA